MSDDLDPDLGMEGLDDEVAPLALAYQAIEHAVFAQGRVGDVRFVPETGEIAVFTGLETRRESLTALLASLDGLDEDAVPARLDEIARALVPRRQPSKAWKDVRKKVVPALFPVTAFGLNEAGKTFTPKLSEERLPLLQEVYSVEVDGVPAYFTNEHFKRWGQSPDAVVQQAYENLVARFEKDEVEQLDMEDVPFPVYQLRAKDGLASSRCLVPQWFSIFESEGLVEGQAIAAMPDRNLVVVCGASEPDAVVFLSRLARMLYFEAEYPLSPCVYAVDPEGDVMPVEGPEGDDSELSNALDVGETLHLATEYGRQTRQLDAFHEAAEDGDDDLIAAEVNLTEPDDDDDDDDEAGESLQFSHSTWIEGTRPLLPLTDLVLLAGRLEADQESGEARPSWHFFVSITALREALGDDLEEVEGLNPPRFRPARWLTDGEIETLRANAIDMQAETDEDGGVTIDDDGIDYASLFQLDPRARFAGIVLDGGAPTLAVGGNSEPVDLFAQEYAPLADILIPIDETGDAADIANLEFEPG